MYQRIELIGNLGSDPESRFTPDGIMVTSFSVATHKVWTDKDGNKQEQVVWWRVSCWRQLADTAGRYLHKGSKVFIAGEVNPVRVYQKQDGTMAASLEVMAREIKFLSSKGEEAMPPAQAAAARVAAQPTPGGQDTNVDDVPF